MKMKECYCIHCGFKNKLKDKYCVNCHKKLKERDKALETYIFEQSIDDIKDNFIGSIFDKIKFLIKKYAYGVILSVAIVSSAVTYMVVNGDNNIVVTEKPVFEKFNVDLKNIQSIMTNLETYFRNQDLNKLSSLMYDTYFQEDAQKLKINPMHNKLIDNIKIFNNSTYDFLYDLDSLIMLNGRDDSKYYGEVANILQSQNLETYNLSFTLLYLEANTKETITFFDFDLVLVKIAENYYIADVTYYNDEARLEEFIKANGNINKLG